MACYLPFPCYSFLILSAVAGASASATNVDCAEATIADIQAYFNDGRLTSQQLVEYYLSRIQSLNPDLNAVIEVNPDAISDANRADLQRRSGGRPRGALHGIPILLKDNIATRDRLNTTAGSFALLGSVVPRDAGVVHRLRDAGAIILGKASMSEWAYFRSSTAPSGWSARGGQGRNPYAPEASPCGSSSGSAIAAAAGMAAVTLGTETDGSILCPSAANSVVGIKPTLGLTSRAGVVPISPRQDTVGPICRTVADAAAVLEAIVGYDDRDAEATAAAARFVPEGGYQQFLKVEGLKGKRLGILRKGFFEFGKGTVEERDFAAHFRVMKKEQQNMVRISSWMQRRLLREWLMKEKRLDSFLTPGSTFSPILAIGGYPGITVPAGYTSNGAPFGICFGGLKGSEPKLIEIAYAFEQATKVRKQPFLQKQ